MRALTTTEFALVAGGTGCAPAPVCHPAPQPCKPAKQKGNNGFGNGGGDGVPGKSGKSDICR
jgi:hypothetical protein